MVAKDSKNQKGFASIDCTRYKKELVYKILLWSIMIWFMSFVIKLQENF